VRLAPSGVAGCDLARSANRAAQRRRGEIDERLDVGVADARPGTHALQAADLVGPQVADAGHDALIEQRSHDRAVGVGVQGEVTVEAGGLAEVPGLAGAIGRCALSRDFQANFRGILRNASTAGRRVTQITVRCGPTGIVGRFASLTLSEAESLWLNPVDAGNSSHQADVPH
jgi:hypothetical protein